MVSTQDDPLEGLGDFAGMFELEPGHLAVFLAQGMGQGPGAGHGVGIGLGHHDHQDRYQDQEHWQSGRQEQFWAEFHRSPLF